MGTGETPPKTRQQTPPRTPPQMPVQSPMKGFSVPSDTKMPQTQADLAIYCKSLLVQMQGRFTDMSDGLVARIDELGARIDDLEASISTLIDKTGVPPEVSSGR